ncbi:hypothetical protein BN1708_004260 [Verticillium longisporum]|uniref:Acetyl-coenzyme A transporter 1 n=1 Tax=Verticillium longisporum TaxID=100787 RepID=A0A0G4LY57_VERLO|nr:hypothetical protein BN1708_004260 [Verticillium longisporum]
MSVRTRRNKSPKDKRPPELSVSTTATSNGKGNNANAAAASTTTMNQNNVEFRRKASTPGSDSVTANLMSRDTFTLDEPVPKTPTANNHGFFELPIQDQKNFLLLVLLYFLQGIPMGLAGGSVPFLMKDHMSYSEIGIFSLASYPYSLKLFWSPIIDAVWSPSFGRRKSWILPIQMLSGIGMLWLGSTVENMMATTGKPGGPTVWTFTGWWFFLVLMCATQDIAVDGWALTLLTPGNVSYASTAQTVGLTAGHFMSYTVFLAFNSDGIWDVYQIMWGVLKLKNIQTIIVVHLIAKIGFQANDAVTNLKLIDKGFGQENMALTVLIDFPFEIVLGYYAGNWSQRYTPMRLWCWAFVGRLAAAVLAQITVAIFPAGGVTGLYMLVVIAEHIWSTFTNTVMFVAVSAFHARVSDPAIGGTYMTLLATVCNLGGTFPRFFVLRLVDYFTVATCHPGNAPNLDALKGPVVTSPFSCSLQADKERCVKGGGTCTMVQDGYYIVNVICVALGLLTFLLYIRPRVLHLQSLPMRAWRLAPTNMKP